MSHIDELIAEHCPNGVPYLPIGSNKVSEKVVAGATPKTGRSEFWDGGTIPWMSSGEVNKGTIYETDQLITHVAYEATSTKMIPAGSVVMALAGQGKTRGTVARTRIELCTNQSLASIVVSSDMDSDFLYYFLQTQYKKLRDVSSGEGTRGGLNLQMIRSYKVPVPPLEVQREIVRILDTFSKMEAELEAELEARKQQYEHYRVSLLTSVESAKWSTLGDISSRVSTGATPKAGKPEYYRDGTIPWLRTGEVTFGEVFDTEIKITDQALKETGTSWIKENCVIVAISGATAARSAINKIPLTTNQHCCNLQIDESLANYRFVFFWVSSKYEELKSLGRGARSDLNTKIIKDFPIPVPSLEEQARIVGILDKFDALVNDLSVGLPAELAARRQQYEYYRDKLLTFRELETAS